MLLRIFGSIDSFICNILLHDTRFVHVPHPHTGKLLSEALMECIFDWNIDRKLSTLTIDNCSTNDAMIDILLRKLDLRTLWLRGSLFHIRCCAHILNLIVKEGLSVISDGIEKIRETVYFWTHTPKRKEKFDEGVRQLQISCTKKMGLDCATRWNSTYVMLKTALEYKDVFPRLRQREPQYDCLPSETDWEFAKEMCDRLEPFYSMTELFSGSSYPTSNVFFDEVCEIRLELSRWLNSDMQEVQVMASKMIAKFEKYWSVIHGVLAIATVLDPRFKMRLIQFYFPQIYGSHHTEEVQRVKELCCDLMKFYTSSSNTTEDPQRSTSTISSSSSKRDGSSSSTSLVNRKDRYLRFEEFVHNVENDVDNVKSELDHYLDETLLPRSDDFDILQWWKLNGVKYPTLYQIAKDVLAVPITTVASESAFSIGGRHVGKHRSQIHSNLLEALMCTQDWLWAEGMS